MVTGNDSPAHIAELVAKYREYYADVGYSENTVYPGIPDLLDALHMTQIPLAVCTSKRADFAERILEMFNLRHHFAFVSGGDVGIEKTHQIAELVQQGTVTASSIMIGDRSVDVIAAHQNGIQAAGVLWDLVHVRTRSRTPNVHFREARRHELPLRASLPMTPIRIERRWWHFACFNAPAYISLRCGAAIGGSVSPALVPLHSKVGIEKMGLDQHKEWRR